MNPDLPREQREFRVTATATLTDGRSVEETSRHFRGSIENPMTAGEHLVKYRDCAERVLSPSDAEHVRGLVQKLDELPDVEELMQRIGQTAAVS